ncbi:PUA-like domain-containing protein [Exophiala viscosa]|uniref:Thymocyte nuclear protein 1 n=1 Tax=Exophiala viscosa TaxID=2486360 RepID=A0AAN6DZR4_9EURO|nr:PUA-like domain-containing protein [Exophiala viscosa]
MPPKKRKAPAAAGTAAKRVRIGSTSEIPDAVPVPTISPSGRPKRTSVSEPQYDFNNHRPSRTTKKAADPPVTKPEVQVKKRGPGRPPKKAAANKEDTPKETAVKNTTAKKVAVPAKAAPAKRGRGRPPKASKPVQSIESDSEDVLNGESTVGVDANAAKTNEEEDLDKDIQYWLMKAEPESRIEKGHDVKFSIDDLATRTEPEGWDGVRNPSARNNMRAMRKGDLAFFYHSNCAVPGVAGVMRIVAEHSVDESAFDPDHPYYDPKSDREKPKWELVHVEFVKKFDKIVTLKELKSYALNGGVLENMQTLKQSRLSVSAVTPAEWRFVLNVAGEKPSLGHGSSRDGYESDVDGEGEETAADADTEEVNGVSDDGLRLDDTPGQDLPSDGVVSELSDISIPEPEVGIDG